MIHFRYIQDRISPVMYKLWLWQRMIATCLESSRPIGRVREVDVLERIEGLPAHGGDYGAPQVTVLYLHSWIAHLPTCHIKKYCHYCIHICFLIYIRTLSFIYHCFHSKDELPASPRMARTKRHEYNNISVACFAHFGREHSNSKDSIIYSLNTPIANGGLHCFIGSLLIRRSSAITAP